MPILELSRDAVSLTDPSNRIVFVNRTFTRLYGGSLRCWVGKCPDALHGAGCPSGTSVKVARATCRRGCWAGTLSNVTGDGKVVQVHLRTQPVKQGGRLLGMVGFATVLPTPPAGLSPQQQAIFCHLGQGLQPKEIAHALGVATKTIQTQMARMVEKMRKSHGVRDSRDLLCRAVQRGS
jgi:PAS domain S-box-containing protein